MSEKILVPVLGESITEATVAKWLKKKGEDVNVDEPIIELETDKVNLEVPSPISGVISEINYKNGDIVKVGAELGAISESVDENEKISKIKKETPKIEEENTNNVIDFDSEKKTEVKIFDNEKIKASEKQPLILTKEVAKNQNGNIKRSLSPAVRKIVEENNINVEEVTGTGKDGRILKGDLISLMGVKPKPSQRKIQLGQEERIKMTRHLMKLICQE